MGEQTKCKVCGELRCNRDFPDVTFFGFPVLLQGTCSPCLLELQREFSESPPFKL